MGATADISTSSLSTSVGGPPVHVPENKSPPLLPKDLQYSYYTSINRPPSSICDIYLVTSCLIVARKASIVAFPLLGSNMTDE